MKHVGRCLLFVAIAAGFLGALWWSPNQPARSTPQDWTWEIEVLQDELTQAHEALDAGDQAGAAEWIESARERSATIKQAIQSDHSAWVAQQY